MLPETTALNLNFGTKRVILIGWPAFLRAALDIRSLTFSDILRIIVNILLFNDFGGRKYGS